MINVLYSPVLTYDPETAAGFDEARRKKLSGSFASEDKKNELFTSGVLIEAIRPEGTSVYYKTGGRPEFTKYFDSNTLSSHPCYRSFNVSHSAGFVFCVYSDENDVGADFEASGRQIDVKIAGKLCSENEKKVLEGLEGEEANEFLVKLFTRKEALSKLLGVGLALDFSSCNDKGMSSEWSKKDLISKVEIPDAILGRNKGRSFVVRTVVIENGYLSIAYEYNERKLRDRYELDFRKL